ncbi:hypothetical protein GCM10027089_02220 [Nocardia thraciensis]
MFRDPGRLPGDGAPDGSGGGCDASASAIGVSVILKVVLLFEGHPHVLYYGTIMES